MNTTSEYYTLSRQYWAEYLKDNDLNKLLEKLKKLNRESTPEAEKAVELFGGRYE